MKTNTLLVRTAALSALLALQACSGFSSSTSQPHDPWSIYKLGNVYDCSAVGMPDMRLNSENGPTPGFGCSHQSNIAVMAANPEDLTTPRPLTPADAASRQRVVDAYREGKDTSVAPNAEGTQGLIE